MKYHTSPDTGGIRAHVFHSNSLHHPRRADNLPRVSRHVESTDRGLLKILRPSHGYFPL